MCRFWKMIFTGICLGGPDLSLCALMMTAAQFFMSPVFLKQLRRGCGSALPCPENGWMRRPTASAGKRFMAESLPNLLPPLFFVQAVWRDIWKCCVPCTPKGVSWRGGFYRGSCLRESAQMILWEATCSGSGVDVRASWRRFRSSVWPKGLP